MFSRQVITRGESVSNAAITLRVTRHSDRCLGLENSVKAQKSRFSSKGKKMGNLPKFMFPVPNFVYYTKACVGMGSHGWKSHVCQPRSCVGSSNSEIRLIWHLSVFRDPLWSI